MSSPLVSAEWVAQRLGRPGFVVCDATYCLPDSGHDADRGYAEGHIPGALRFDIDRLADTASDLPHMLPEAPALAALVGELGIGPEDQVVFYDQNGISMAAARGFWTLRALGHKAAFILDGGLSAWLAAGQELARGVVEPRPPRLYPAPQALQGIRSRAALVANVGTGAEQVVDARSRPRWLGETEPWPGRKPGRIPGSRSLPHTELTEGGRLKPRPALQEAFDAAGIDLTRPLVTTCGSGVTACVLALAAHELGARSIAVYDGSWAEWGRSDGPIEAGEPS